MLVLRHGHSGMNKEIAFHHDRLCNDVKFLEGDNFFHDLKAIKELYEFSAETKDNVYIYRQTVELRDKMRADFFGMIADGKINYPLEQLLEFYSSGDKGFYLNGGCSGYEWADATNVYKYSEYWMLMDVIEERKANPLSEDRNDLFSTKNELLNPEQQQEYKEVKKFEVNSDRYKAEKAEQKLRETEQELAQKQADLDRTEQELEVTKQQQKDKEQIEKTFLEGVGISDMSTDERQALFERSNDLRQTRLVMQDVSLTTMCRIYVAEEDTKAKLEFLKELYQIRKGGKTNKDKNEMAGTFVRVLDKTPELKKDENLVALSKRDTVVKQPTRVVKKQVERN